MRKYLLGIVAVALAIGFSAFTKPITKKDKFATYYFAASNIQTLANCASVTVTFPNSEPPQSISSCGGSTNICWLAFPNFVIDGNGKYRPSSNGTSELTNYCSYTASNLKN